MREQEEKPKAKPNRSLAEQLRGRGRMAIACMGGMLLFGLMGVGNPLADRISSAESRIEKATARTALAVDVAGLRHQANLYHKRVPHGVDVNDWTQYLLAILRSQQVKLVKMEPRDQIAIGPCKVLAWQIEIDGPFDGLCRVVAGLENGPRLVRIDSLHMQTPSGKLTLTMMVRGLVFEKAEAPEKPEKSAKADKSEKSVKPEKSMKKEPAK